MLKIWKAGESGVDNPTLHKELSGSARHSRLGLGVANWDFPKFGYIEMVDNLAPAYPVRSSPLVRATTFFYF